MLGSPETELIVVRLLSQTESGASVFRVDVVGKSQASGVPNEIHLSAS